MFMQPKSGGKGDCNNPFTSLSGYFMTRIFSRVVGAGFLTVFLTSCGMWGGTRPLTVNRDSHKSHTIPRVQTAFLDVDKAGIYERAVGVFAIPSYGKDDIVVLRTSLENSLATVPVDTSGRSWTIGLLIRRYKNFYFNDGATILACVSWAVLGEKGQVIFDDQFYVESHGTLIKTIGMVKSGINEKIITRVLDKTIALAEQGLDEASSLVVAGSYESFDEIKKILPKGRSSSNSSIKYNDAWESGRCPDRITWQSNAEPAGWIR